MRGLITLILPAITATCVAISPLGTEHNNRQTRKQKMISTLLGKAQQTQRSHFSRGLDAANAEIDLTGYEIKFDKCQNIKTYDDELAENAQATNVLTTKRFVVFRLCPSGSCSSCAANYGEYVIDLESYIELTTNYFEEEREESCQACENMCYANDDGVRNEASDYVDCDNCKEYCQFVENMGNKGYVDSYKYAECVQVGGDGNGNSIYAGAMCHNKGKQFGLKIGAFSDEACSVYESGSDVEDYLQNGAKLYDDILDKMGSSSSCISCVEKDMNRQDDNDDDAESNDLCTEIYESAGKCESKHGFDNYWKSYDEYANQYVQEEIVCDFIDSLGKGTYDQNGEIILSGTFFGEKTASGFQQFVMVVFAIGAAVAAIYVVQARAKLRSAKADLSAQGGTLA